MVTGHLISFSSQPGSVYPLRLCSLNSAAAEEPADPLNHRKDGRRRFGKICRKSQLKLTNRKNNLLHPHIQNLKKSWHPNTIKNQERVWRAEQADAAERRKLAELKQEISAERDREELHRIGQTSGVLPVAPAASSSSTSSMSMLAAAASSSGTDGKTGSGGKKLEWMYKGTDNLLNREEYLLGRQVDKSFEKQEAAEREAKQQELVGVTKPKNHVEHECIPFSIRQFHGASGAVSVD